MSVCGGLLSGEGTDFDFLFTGKSRSYYRMLSVGEYGKSVLLFRFAPITPVGEDDGIGRYDYRFDLGGMGRLSPHSPVLFGVGPMYKRGIFREIGSPLGYSAFSEITMEKASLSLDGSFSSLDSDTNTHGIFLTPLPGVLSLYYYGRGNVLREGFMNSSTSFYPSLGFLLRPFGNGLLFYSGVAYVSLYAEVLGLMTECHSDDGREKLKSESWYLRVPYFWGDILRHFVMSLWFKVKGDNSEFFLRYDTVFSGGEFVSPGCVEHFYLSVKNLLCEFGLFGGYRSYYFLDSRGNGGDGWFKYSVGIVLNPKGLVLLSGKFSDGYRYPPVHYSSVSRNTLPEEILSSYRFFEHTSRGDLKLRVRLTKLHESLGDDHLEMGVEGKFECDFDSVGGMDQSKEWSLYLESYTPPGDWRLGYVCGGNAFVDDWITLDFRFGFPVGTNGGLWATGAKAAAGYDIGSFERRWFEIKFSGRIGISIFDKKSWKYILLEAGESGDHSRDNLDGNRIAVELSITERDYRAFLKFALVGVNPSINAGWALKESSR